AATDVIVLISKPPAEGVAERVLEAARACGKPVVVNFLGAAPIPDEARLVFADTLEGAALAAIALARHATVSTGLPPLSGDLLAAAATEANRLARGGRRIVGLFSGGTLCKEASHLLAQTDHELVDLGD